MDFNTIKIKAGSGIPGPDVLSERELGWDKENKHLYIGTEDGPYQINIEDYLPLDGGTITGDLTIEGTINFPNGRPFAPSGYGLGASGMWVDDLNAADRCGYYSWTSTALNKPFDYGNMFVIRRSDGRLTQIGIDPFMCGHGGIVVRHYTTAQWTPWEWINPPMSLGVEYRTTERFKGKPVYAKAINLGTLPARNSTINVSHGASAKAIVRCTAVNDGGSGSSIPYGYTSKLFKMIDISATTTTINVWTFDNDYSDYSGVTGTAQIWYIKN